MSRLFAAASSQALTYAGAHNTYPISIACWGKCDTLTADRTLMSLGDPLQPDRFVSLLVRTNGTIRLRYNEGGSPVAPTSTGTVTTGQIFHAGGTLVSTTSRKLYLNGVADGTNTTSYGTSPPHPWTHTYIGRLCDDGSFPGYHDGWVAEAAVWSADLTAAEWLALAAGCSPLQIRPESLWQYWPMYGSDSPEPPLFGAGALTLVNAPTQDDHPRVYASARPALTLVAGSPPATRPIFVHHYRQQGIQ